MSTVRDLPRPSGHIARHFIDMGRDPLRTMPRFLAECGDRVFLDVPRLPTLMLFHPADIHQVLVADSKSYGKDYFTRQLKEILGNGLLTNEGRSWRKQRRLSQPAFHHQAIRGYAETMVERTEAHVAGWPEVASVDMHDEMMRLTLDIASRTLFGHEIGDDARAISRAIDAFMHAYLGLCGSGLRIPAWIPTPTNVRAWRALRELDDIMYRIIELHRGDTGQDHTLLGMLIAATDDDGSAMDDQQLRDEAVTLLMAGHETTAVALTMAFYLLSQHPRVEERLHTELDEVLAGRAPQLEDLALLPYTAAVIKETMRLYPPAWAVGREALQATALLDGVEVPQGTQIWLAQATTQRDARWFPDPGDFLPERWLDGLEKQLPKGAYFPFSLGPRTCIGKRFAEMETHLCLATLARRVSLRLKPGETLNLIPSITLRPGKGLEMIATDRRATRREAA